MRKKKSFGNRFIECDLFVVLKRKGKAHLLKAFEVPSIFTSQHYKEDTALLFLFYRKENSVSEKFTKLYKITQLISGEKVRQLSHQGVEEFPWNPLAWSERRAQDLPGGSK